MGPIRCPETSVRNYHYSLRNNPEERSSHLLRRGSLTLSIIAGLMAHVGFTILSSSLRDFGRNQTYLVLTFSARQAEPPSVSQ